MTEKSLTDLFDERLAEVRQRIAEAAKASGRTEQDITLLAAVKTVEPERINHAISAGITYIGDNRVQELKAKESFLLPGVHKHMIGHLQTNKVKDCIGRVEMIESVGSLHLAEEISRQAVAHGTVMDILAEVNLANETTKTGFSLAELDKALEKTAELPGVRLRGLMAIPPAGLTDAENCRYFSQMYELFIDIKQKNRDNRVVDTLSMGMSDTYESAIRCGATLVRLGTVLFGSRNYNQ